MNTQSAPFRVFAVLLSLTLMAGFVYYRAGGNPLADLGAEIGGSSDQQVEELKLKIEQLEQKIDQLLADRESPEADPFIVPVSLPGESSDSAPSTDFLFGPKSAPVFLPTDAPPDRTPPPPPTPPTTTPVKKELLPGSKSRAVVDPEMLLPAKTLSKSSAKPPNPPRDNDPSSRPAILPGSKSIILADPVTTQPQQQQVQRSKPQPRPQPRNAMKPANKPRASANQRDEQRQRLLPGSKSDGIFNANDLPRQQAAQPRAQSRGSYDSYDRNQEPSR
jgi:hypothetical protein